MYAEARTFIDEHPFVEDGPTRPAASRPPTPSVISTRAARRRSRETVNSTVRPAGGCGSPRSARCRRSTRCRRPVTTSPFSSPARSAGVPASTSLISAPVASSSPPVRDLGADHRVARLAGAQDLVGGDLTCSIGMAKPTPMLPASPCDRAARGGDGGVDADDLAPQVDQRAAGVAGVDRRVGLHGVDVGELVVRVARGDRPVERADDAGGDRRAQPERRAEGDHRVADVQRLRGAERRRRQVRALLDEQDGEVVGRAAADDARRRSGCRPGRRPRSGRRSRRRRRRRGCW